jgi:tripartite-type tricarboxylate transporter receptor subunit TctC
LSQKAADHFRGKLEQAGFDVFGQTGPELPAEIKAQIEKWAQIVNSTGFNVD